MTTEEKLKELLKKIREMTDEEIREAFCEPYEQDPVFVAWLEEALKSNPPDKN